jgi:hypothetical protein
MAHPTFRSTALGKGGPSGEATNGVTPIDQQFSGDFRMRLVYANNGIVNLIMQLAFTNVILPGFRVRAHGNKGNLDRAADPGREASAGLELGLCRRPDRERQPVLDFDHP